MGAVNLDRALDVIEAALLLAIIVIVLGRFVIAQT